MFLNIFCLSEKTERVDDCYKPCRGTVLSKVRKWPRLPRSVRVSPELSCFGLKAFKDQKVKEEDTLCFVANFSSPSILIRLTATLEEIEIQAKYHLHVLFCMSGVGYLTWRRRVLRTTGRMVFLLRVKNALKRRVDGSYSPLRDF